MTGFLTCLVGHVFLHTGIQQNIRQTRRKVQGALSVVIILEICQRIISLPSLICYPSSSQSSTEPLNS